MMQRYLVFAGDIYYPDGGWNDFCGSYPDLKAAKHVLDGRLAGAPAGCEWGHVVDTVIGKVVYRGWSTAP